MSTNFTQSLMVRLPVDHPTTQLVQIHLLEVSIQQDSQGNAVVQSTEIGNRTAISGKDGKEVLTTGEPIHGTKAAVQRFGLMSAVQSILIILIAAQDLIQM